MARLIQRFATSVLSLAVLLVCAPLAAAEDFVVLCHQENPVPSLSKSHLRKLFTGGIKQWESGALVQVALINGNAPETAYLAKMLDMTPWELTFRIQEQIYKGEMKRPVALRSSADCGAFARATPGAICISAAGHTVPGTRVVPVN
jgi:hypothetical protein